MKSLKSMLLQLLGQRNYLSLTSSIFFVMLRRGWLKRNPLYDTHYFVPQFIQPGQTVLDIGANLGYYTQPFAQKVGGLGRVFAVEPIGMYREVLIRNTNHLPQVTILAVALGEEEGVLKMGNPSQDIHRHGLMRVLTPQESINATVYEVPVKNPLQLFNHLNRIDYIKCDIEGYEVPVIPIMEPLIEKHLPILQIEVEQKNIDAIFSMLTNLQYQLFYAKGAFLQPFLTAQQHLPADLLGIPRSKMNAFQHLIIHE